MNIKGSKASNVLGGKTVRACDSCVVKRARWFCAADDAFLCQSCDAAVHSANQLASRHERVRLDTASRKPSLSSSSAPAWHQGFTRKARTPRNSSKPASRQACHHQLPVVPEIGVDDLFPEEDDQHVFCRVPDFDVEYFSTELMVKGEDEGFGIGIGDMSMVFDDDDDSRELNLEELLLSSCDDEFAADVDSLLGKGPIDGSVDEKRVKIEEKVEDIIGFQFDSALDADMNWDLGCAMNEEVGKEETAHMVVVKNNISEMENYESLSHEKTDDKRKKKLLRLNYEAVMAAWATQGSNSPWTDAIRPQLDQLEQFMGTWCDEWEGKEGRRWRRNDAGREARVSRYREKRRTRLFSKKIRYEVRKLNAEKRPRMKGRFVKRTTFLGSSSPYHNLIDNSIK